MNSLFSKLKPIFHHARPWIHKPEPREPGATFGIQFEYEWPDTAKTLKAETSHPDTSNKTKSNNE